MATHTKENLDNLIEVFDKGMKYLDEQFALIKSGAQMSVIELKPSL